MLELETELDSFTVRWGSLDKCGTPTNLLGRVSVNKYRKLVLCSFGRDLTRSATAAAATQTDLHTLIWQRSCCTVVYIEKIFNINTLMRSSWM